MKENAQIVYAEVNVTCSCGNIFTTRSTRDAALHIEVCAHCHPFYTGKQQRLATSGRVEKFKLRYARKDNKVMS